MQTLKLNLTREEITARINACREELAALKRLLRAVHAIEQAEDARRRRTCTAKEASS